MDVEQFEVVATLDSHTSAICQEMDGKVFPMKDYEPGVTAPPFHVWCRSCTVPYFDEFNIGERAARGEDGKTYYVDSEMKYDDWKEKYVKDAASDDDKKEFAKYQKDLGKNAPETLEKFIDLKYNNDKDFKDLKGLSKYREQVPNANLKEYLLNKELKEKKLIRGNIVPYETHRAHILEDKAFKKDPAHIMKRMFERDITDDQVQSFVDNALLVETQFKGTRLKYFSLDGVTVLTKTSDYKDIRWIAKTTWSKYDFDEETSTILEVAKKYV